MNVTYFDALSNHSDSDDFRIQRFLLAHSILLTLTGVPAVYIQSVLGSRNYYEGVEKTGMNRTINRQKYDIQEITDALEDETTLRHKIFKNLTRLIQIRKTVPAFHPNAGLKLIPTSDALFAYEREYGGESYQIVHNISSKRLVYNLDNHSYKNIIQAVPEGISGWIELAPYEFQWLKKEN